MNLLDILRASPATLLVFAGLAGLIFGSFLNVVIHRLPIMMQRQWARDVAQHEGRELPPSEPFNLMRPDSHCPHCQHRIRAWENIPLLSYIVLRGRCSHCQAPISLRYPLLELAAAILALAVAWRFGASLQTLALMGFFWTLLTLTAIDIDHQLLPDVLTLPLLWVGLLLNLNGLFTPLPDAVLGAALGYSSLWSLYWVFKLLTGKDGMGFGDFKLFAAFGAWFGWASLPLIIFLAAIVGAVLGLAAIAVMGRQRQLPIPFGPYLCGAALVYVFWGDALMHWYLRGLA
ncbi:prepilin peptidase [Saccharospirillum mangrovi]|uniref:prepilin peptidase n=1 Tax=Saccharospirillum mangrovi TaxID=2161747 RepID=UPI000D3558C2|nr:A24 family peptidase [Saccharospirillum mangrovi]